ncbi:hypothetical protein ALC53_05326 [Atta colombica]|uniref:Uncharacterized protein n=1 Tax=Atta colombica TaxID=520822 RepID=A0A195BJJ4_9HYME|nr:hypothetical protein ALC53_05326 [Atta colombica]
MHARAAIGDDMCASATQNIARLQHALYGTKYSHLYPQATRKEKGRDNDSGNATIRPMIKSLAATMRYHPDRDTRAHAAPSWTFTLYT